MSTTKISSTSAGMAEIAYRYPMVYEAFYKTPGLLVSTAAILGVICGTFHIGSTIGEAIWGGWSYAMATIRIAAWFVLAVLGNIILVQFLHLALIAAVRIRAARWAKDHEITLEFMSTEMGMNEVNSVLIRQEVARSLNKAGKRLGKKGISIEAKGDMQIIDRRNESKDSGLSNEARSNQ